MISTSILVSLLSFIHFSCFTGTPHRSKNLRLFSSSAGLGQTISFDDIFNGLNFGYERPRVVEGDDRSSDVGGVVKNCNVKEKHTVSQNALCYPQEVRMRGCQTLYDSTSKVTLDPSSLQKLPCVIDGSCPYIQFRCSRGHTWKGIAGSPVCFHCPICQSARKVYGRRKEATADRLMKSLKAYTVTRGDELISETIEGRNKWGSTVHLKCKSGHLWSGKVGNILLNKCGCLQCAISTKRLDEGQLHRTAKFFGGEFLGFADSLNSHSTAATSESDSATTSVLVRRALWRCSEGHIFNEIAGNIRRSPDGKRKCSWCKICRKNGSEFVWNSDRINSVSVDELPTLTVPMSPD